MKSTTYIIEITNQKNENYLYMGRNPVAWLPPCLVLTKKFSACVSWKVFCCFWPIKLRDLHHVVSAAPIWTWFSWKLAKTPKNYIVFFEIFLFNPLYDFWIY